MTSILSHLIINCMTDNKGFTTTIHKGLDKDSRSRHIKVAGEDEDYITKLKVEKKEKDARTTHRPKR